MVAQPLRGVVGAVGDVWSRYAVPLAEVVGLYSLGHLLHSGWYLPSWGDTCGAVHVSCGRRTLGWCLSSCGFDVQ